MLKLTYTYTPIFVAANCSIKLSILFFYRRIFDSDTRFKRIVNWSIVFVILWTVTFTFLGIFVCTPLHAYWAPLPVHGQRCYDVEGFISYGGIDVAVDLWLMLIFQIKIWRMKLPLSKRLSIGLIMSLAGLAVAATVMRIPFILKACLHVDKTWDGMELTLWSTGELTIGITCASAPALRAYFTKKHRHVLVGRLHSMGEWASGGGVTHRTVRENRDVESGDLSIEAETVTNCPFSVLDEENENQRVESVLVEVSGKSGATRVDSAATMSGKSLSMSSTNVDNGVP